MRAPGFDAVAVRRERDARLIAKEAFVPVPDRAWHVGIGGFRFDGRPIAFKDAALELRLREILERSSAGDDGGNVVVLRRSGEPRSSRRGLDTGWTVFLLEGHLRICQRVVFVHDEARAIGADGEAEFLEVPIVKASASAGATASLANGYDS